MPSPSIDFFDTKMSLKHFSTLFLICILSGKFCNEIEIRNRYLIIWHFYYEFHILFIQFFQYQPMMSSNAISVVHMIHGATILMKYIIMGMKHKKFVPPKNVWFLVKWFLFLIIVLIRVITNLMYIEYIY